MKLTLVVIAVAACIVVIAAAVSCSLHGASSRAGDSVLGSRESSLTAVDLPGASGGSGGQVESASAMADVVPTTTDTYDLVADDLLNVPDCDTVQNFNLSAGHDFAALGDDSLAKVRGIVSSIEEVAPCGFVFLDTKTGHGIAYNTGKQLYIASAAKALLSYYAVTQGATQSDYVADQIKFAIEESDNNSYESFGYRYFDSSFIEWLDSHGISHQLYTGDLYPPTTARSLASAWAEILLFLGEGSDDARWLGEAFANTSTSFIRDALDDDGATVMNKAGWISDPEFDSVTDAGIVVKGDRAYLMVIETGAPAWGDTEEKVSDLAQALFDLRAVM